MSILVEDFITGAKSWSIDEDIGNSSTNEVDLNFRWSGQNGGYTSPWSNCHHKLCFKCSANIYIHPWKQVCIVHHIKDFFASLRAFLYLSMQSCFFWSVRRVYRPTFYIASEATRQETTLYHLSHVAAFFACGVSLCTTAAVSMDRLAALHFHMRYCSLVTVPRVLCTSVMLWAINVLFSSIYFANWKVTYIIMAVGIGTWMTIPLDRNISLYEIEKKASTKTYN